MRQSLLIFAKNPVYGKVKTRLAATIGNDKALFIYLELLKSTIAVTRYLPVNKIVYYSDYIEKNDIWDNAIFTKQVQAGKDLGQRMNNAFVHAFNKGNEKVVIIGTDCPQINSAILMNAFAYLDSYDTVIGPAKDGGYYLLGMKQAHAKLFENILWSTSSVLKQSINACSQSNLSHYLLPELSDVDEEKDLMYLKTDE